MPLKRVYVLARSHGRPTLMHLLLDGQTQLTACGRNVSEWSRAFLPKRVLDTNPDLEHILCKKAGCRA